MPRRYNLFNRDPQPPYGARKWILSFWRSEGERRVVYYSHDLGTADDATYWSHLFAVQDKQAPVMGTYDGTELRWSISPDCIKPDYLVQEGAANDVVRMSSNNEYDDGQWYRWIELRAAEAHSFEAGQLAAFLARNVADQAVRLRVMILHDSPAGPLTDAQDVFHAPLGDF